MAEPERLHQVVGVGGAVEDAARGSQRRFRVVPRQHGVAVGPEGQVAPAPPLAGRRRPPQLAAAVAPAVAAALARVGHMLGRKAVAADVAPVPDERERVPVDRYGGEPFQAHGLGAAAPDHSHHVAAPALQLAGDGNGGGEVR